MKDLSAIQREEERAHIQAWGWAHMFLFQVPDKKLKM